MLPSLNPSVRGRTLRAALAALAFATLAGTALLPGCGARTELRPAQPCAFEGEQQACIGVCGEGITTCEAGVWSACRVELVQELCTDVCGEGIRTCEEEVWSECDVPPVAVECENSCGVGVQRCEENLWATCEVEPLEEECFSKCGSGTRSCEEDVWSVCTAPQPLPPTLTALVRDFSDTHPDFERETGAIDMGIVEPTLGVDGKPVYAGPAGGTVTTTGPSFFDQWYRDVPGVNEATEVSLPLSVSPIDDRLYTFYGPNFFPIDNQLFGNEGRAHNYHFTLEAFGTFVYQGGETFSFTGDDDVFVYVNNQLVIDLGGLHQSLSATVSLDQIAGSVGLVLGGEYPLQIFFAERKTVDSNFNIETSIAGLGECPTP